MKQVPPFAVLQTRPIHMPRPLTTHKCQLMTLVGITQALLIFLLLFFLLFVFFPFTLTSITLKFEFIYCFVSNSDLTKLNDLSSPFSFHLGLWHHCSFFLFISNGQCLSLIVSVRTSVSFFWSFQSRTHGIWRLQGQESNQSYSRWPTPWPTPQPHQCQIRATSVTYTTAHGNTGSLTH